MTGSIFVCPVLNFLLRHIAKDKKSIVQIAANFFGKDSINYVIERCKNAFHVDIFKIRRGSHPGIHFLSDIWELISGIVQRDEPPPLFVIADLSDMPSFPDDAPTIAASRLNECVHMLNFLVEKQDTCSQVPISTVWPSVSPRKPPPFLSC